MIKRLKAFVIWLESRFPEKVVVVVEDYNRLKESVDRVIDRAEAGITASQYALDRIAAIEKAAVHKEAVQDLITVVKVLKDDVTAMKANIGWDAKAAKQDEITALLNGEAI